MENQIIDDIRGIGTATKVTMFDIVPCPAPRSTRHTKNMHLWTDEYCIGADKAYFEKTGTKGTLLYEKQRKLRYMEYKLNLKNLAELIQYKQPEDAFAIWFFIPVTKSWTKKKKREMIGQCHKIQLDTDNLVKGFLDGIMPKALRFLGQKGGNDDRKVSSFAAFKVWCPEDMTGRIFVAEYPRLQFMDAFWKDIKPLVNFDIQ
jgi:Holliday junction resolvase RusA-like endonuclease